MTNAQLFRIGGLLLLIGCIGFIVHLIGRSVITANAAGDAATFAKAALWTPINALGAVSVTVEAAAPTVLSVRKSARARRQARGRASPCEGAREGR